MVLGNVIVDITISSRSFVFSQSDVQISAGLTNISGLAVAAFDFINCSPSVARFVFAGRNLNVRLTEHKRATRNGDINNHIAEHHLKTNHRIDWDSAECVTYSTDYYQRITLESWFTNLEQTPLNRCQQLPAPYKRLIADNNKTDKQ